MMMKKYQLALSLLLFLRACFLCHFYFLILDFFLGPSLFLLCLACAFGEPSVGFLTLGVLMTFSSTSVIVFSLDLSGILFFSRLLMFVGLGGFVGLKILVGLLTGLLMT